MTSYPLLQQLLQTSTDVVAPVDTCNYPASLYSAPPVARPSTPRPFMVRTTPALYSTTPFAVIKPTIINKPILHPTLYKNKQNKDTYYKTLVNYNEMLKKKETYLDSLLLCSTLNSLTIDETPPRNPFSSNKINNTVSRLRTFKTKPNQNPDQN